MARRKTPARERLWARVDVRGPDECWPWLGGRTTAGYGSLFGDDGKVTSTHRVAYADRVGPIPPGGHVLHHCDNPPCCNPRHLFLGDQAANMADMAAKGRSGARRTHYAPGEHWTHRSPQRGEAHPQAKLTEDGVRAIRALYAEGFSTQRALARAYGVSQRQILRIVHGQTWVGV